MNVLEITPTAAVTDAPTAAPIAVFVAPSVVHTQLSDAGDIIKIEFDLPTNAPGSYIYIYTYVYV